MSEAQGYEPSARYKNFDAAYKAVTGFEFPQTPEELPLELLLPPEAIGDLIAAVLAQETIDVAQGLLPRERAQLVGLLSHKGELENSKVSVGSESRAGNFGLTMARWMRPFLGLSSKPIAYWHTHTPKHSAFPAIDDILHAVAEDREGALYIVGSPTEITVIIQTKKAVPKILPLSTTNKGFKALDDVSPLYDDTDNPQPDFPKLAAYLEQKGLAMYCWKKGEYSTVAAAAQAGEFSRGVHLQRISTQPSVTTK